MKTLKFDLKDIAIVPAIVSSVNSRSECNTKTDTSFLPLMAAPMDTVVCQKNLNTYIDNGIIPCLPRGEYHKPHSFNRDMVFQSYGLDEIEYDLELLKNIEIDGNYIKHPFYHYDYILIDIANGHMQRLVDIIKDIKTFKPKIQIMVGNVGHPLTYKNLAMAGADYVRCSIGTGCFTPGQIIKLENQEKNIEDVEIGDKVLTHKNKYETIKNKFEYTISEEVYNINDIQCTKLHEFYVIEKQYANIVNDKNLEEYAEWISAKELDKEKHLLIEY